MVSQGASKVNISFIVNDTESIDVIKALHLDFFESGSLEDEAAKRRRS
jgi:aspartate kinase